MLHRASKHSIASTQIPLDQETNRTNRTAGVAAKLVTSLPYSTTCGGVPKVNGPRQRSRPPIMERHARISWRDITPQRFTTSMSSAGASVPGALEATGATRCVREPTGGVTVSRAMIEPPYV
jgi:hypothetical protein